MSARGARTTGGAGIAGRRPTTVSARRDRTTDRGRRGRAAAQSLPRSPVRLDGSWCRRGTAAAPFPPLRDLVEDRPRGPVPWTLQGSTSGLAGPALGFAVLDLGVDALSDGEQFGLLTGFV